eukprot:11028783-Lingulodinium_polyedra.AAC.1
MGSAHKAWPHAPHTRARAAQGCSDDSLPELKPRSKIPLGRRLRRQVRRVRVSSSGWQLAHGCARRPGRGTV